MNVSKNEACTCHCEGACRLKILGTVFVAIPPVQRVGSCGMYVWMGTSVQTEHACLRVCRQTRNVLYITSVDQLINVQHIPCPRTLPSTTSNEEDVSLKRASL